jgi:hypothetical protein
MREDDGHMFYKAGIFMPALRRASRRLGESQEVTMSNTSEFIVRSRYYSTIVYLNAQKGGYPASAYEKIKISQHWTTLLRLQDQKKPIKCPYSIILRLRLALRSALPAVSGTAVTVVPLAVLLCPAAPVPNLLVPTLEASALLSLIPDVSVASEEYRLDVLLDFSSDGSRSDDLELGRELVSADRGGDEEVKS